MVSDSARTFLPRLMEFRRSGLSGEEIAARILAAEPESAEHWICALVEIALESSWLDDPKRNA
jgi:hypothetical protein